MSNKWNIYINIQHKSFLFVDDIFITNLKSYKLLNLPWISGHSNLPSHLRRHKQNPRRPWETQPTCWPQNIETIGIWTICVGFPSEHVLWNLNQVFHLNNRGQSHRGQAPVKSVWICASSDWTVHELWMIAMDFSFDHVSFSELFCWSLLFL